MQTPNVTKRKLPLLALVIVGLVVAAGLVWGGMMLFNKATVNYAEETARPLEEALVNAGAVKKCDRGSDGHGPDNLSPWYKAMYEVPGKTDAAVTLVQRAAKESGYNLTEGPNPANPGSNKFYSDKTSKQSSYNDLSAGNVSLVTTVYGESKYSGDQNCTVVKKDGSDPDKTTVDLTVGLPSFKQ